MAKQPKYSSIEDYFAAATPEARAILEEIRRIVVSSVPDAEPVISYQLPAFRKGRVFFYFAAFKAHIGIFPPVRDDERLEQDLRPYRGPKGNLKFPLGHPMPFDVIKRVVEALAEQYS